MRGDLQMKVAIFSIAISVMTAVPAMAQERTALPEIIVGAPPPSVILPGPAQGPGAGAPHAGGGTHQGCAGGETGSDHSLACLNEKLKSQVDRVSPVANVPPLDAKSSDLKIGVVNVPGVQQQYGRNFGVSIYPYRPPTPTYAAPGGRR
jgi:hypothetical protein